jgi:hypothetical protein
MDRGKVEGPRYATALLFLAVLAFYAYTLAPSLAWADGARLQVDVTLGGSIYWFFQEAGQVPTDGGPFDRLGVAAWDHPLYVMLGQVFLALPWGDPLARINLMSALAAALVVALVYRVGWTLAGDRWAAALGALALAVSHTFWFHAVTAEVYALHALFMVSLIWLALRWPRHRRWRELALFAFLSGLGLANHIMLILTILPALVYLLLMARAPLPSGRFPGGTRDGLRWVVGWRGIGLAAAFLVGFAPWWVQFIRMARIIGLPLTLELAVGLPWLPHRVGIPSAWAGLTDALTYAGWLVYQFTPLGVACGVYGFLCLRRAQLPVARFLLALFILHAAFSANYAVPDRFAFHLPSYLVFALFLSPGSAGLIGKLRARLPARAGLGAGLRGLSLALALAPIPLYAAVPSLLRSWGVTESQVGVEPIGTGARDTWAYFLDPNQRGDDSAARFGRSTLAGLAPRALVFTPKQSDQEAYIVLRYYQLVEGLRPDVHLELLLFERADVAAQALLELARAQAGCRPLYLASLNAATVPLATLRAEFEIVPEANLFRLVPLRPVPTAAPCPDLESRWAGISPEQLIRSAMRWR